MKKRLLFALMAVSASVSSFALSQGEFVYTPQGRFQVTGENINANSAFQDLSGWTLISASADKTLADQFNVNGNGYADGINSVQSLDNTAGEGMYYKFEPSDAGSAFVVSFKLKGTALACIETRIPGDGNKRGDNLVKVEGNSDGVYVREDGEVLNDVLLCNTAEELTEEWQTFNYAIVGDGTARTYFISFTGMATSIELADLQIAPAMQFADLRQRDAMLEKLNAYKNCYDWANGELDDFAVNETIESLEAIGDETGQGELDEVLATAQEVLDEFLKENMDDYLATSESFTATTNNAGTPAVDNKFNNWLAKVQKAYTWGDWNCLPDGRGFWENEAQGAADLGHYAGNSAWNYGDTSGAMGVYTKKTLDAGAYVFGIDSRAAIREDATSTSWTNNEGWNVAYGVAYVVKIENEEATDTIASIVKDLDAIEYTQFVIPATIAESGTYEIGFKAYCKDAYKDLKNGSVVYIKNASLWGKNNNKYNQKQLGYEADVLEQITTGRNQITTAIGYIDDASYLWGKATLQACLDSVEVKIANYELLSEDEIIATYDNYDGDYAKSTSSEDGILVYEVYQAAVKDIIAANRKFIAVNDTLASLQSAIESAEGTLALRVYSAATGKDALQAAISSAKDVQSQMKAADYSEENANTIKATNEALAAAIEEFKASVPASASTTIVDIDFEQDAVQNEETQLYSITGAAGTMEFSKFVVDANSTDQSFQQGYWNNGEQMYKGYVRVGNGTGTVTFDPTENGSMGNNILKVSFDFFLQGLSGRNVGFFLKDETGEVNVAGFFANYYNGTIDATSNLNVELASLKYASGGNYNNAAPQGAEGAGDYTCAQNHFEVILDFGEGSMYVTTTSDKGVVTTAKQEFDKTIPYSFVLQCNYNNDDRRVWFDNLKIERVAAGAAEPFVDAVEAVKAVAADGAVYNLSGQRLNAVPAKGLYIQNGKKFVVK